MNNMDRFKFRVFWEHKNSNTKLMEEVNILDFANNEARLDLNCIPEINEAGGCDPLEYNLDECTLMQSTGLKDKNGTLIFEGDILKDPLYNESPILWKVIPSDYSGQLIESIESEARQYYFYEHDFEPKQLEIIGNIYENPDLLKTSNGE